MGDNGGDHQRRNSYTNTELKQIRQQSWNVIRPNPQIIIIIRKLCLNRYRQNRHRDKTGGKSQHTKNIERDIHMARSVI